MNLESPKASRVAILGIPGISEIGNAGAGGSSCLVRLAEARPKTPGFWLFSGSSWHKAPRPPCHPPVEVATELRETVVPVWGNSRCISLPAFTPGLRPLPTMGRGLNFLHQSPDLLDLRKKRVFCGYFLRLLFQALLEWRWLHPQGKLSIASPGEWDRAEGGGLLFLKEKLRFFLPGL